MSSSNGSPVLIIGGTRGTGLLIARLLFHDGIPVRILARDPSAARDRLGGGCEIFRGDLTDAPSLRPALANARHVVFTAGVRSGRPARASRVRRTEYQGVVNTLAAATAAGFDGRLLYMTSSGVNHSSFWTIALNIYKGGTLRWRRQAEAAIRESSLDYTIIRTGVLLNSPARPHAVTLTQHSLPLSPKYRIARADVAQIFRAALDEPAAARATFEAVWTTAPKRPWREALSKLTPDP